MLSEPDHLDLAQRACSTRSPGPQLQAVVAFGVQARVAVGLWDSKPDVPVFEVPHPSSRDRQELVDAWRAAITSCAGSSHPTPTATRPDPTTGPSSARPTTPRSRRATCRSGVPDWFGDDNWGRTARPKHNNSVERPGDDLLHTLIWHAPEDRP